MPDNLIVHMTSRKAWERAQEQQVYTIDSLESAGFIHCSRPEQILRVANAYYPAAKDQVLLWIDPQRVQPEIRWETSGEDIFPHIYGPLNLDAVTRIDEFIPDEDGVFRRLPGQKE